MDTNHLVDYLEIVSTPMDHGTVLSRLEQYASADEFVRDMRLAASNVEHMYFGENPPFKEFLRACVVDESSRLL